MPRRAQNRIAYRNVSRPYPETNSHAYPSSGRASSLRSSLPDILLRIVLKDNQGVKCNQAEMVPVWQVKSQSHTWWVSSESECDTRQYTNQAAAGCYSHLSVPDNGYDIAFSGLEIALGHAKKWLTSRMHNGIVRLWEMMKWVCLIVVSNLVPSQGLFRIKPHVNTVVFMHFLTHSNSLNKNWIFYC